MVLVIGFIMLLIMWMLFLATFYLIILKVVAFALDYAIILIFGIYFLHNTVSIKISSGNAIYFWDVVFGILIIIIYKFLLIFLKEWIPIVYNIFIYVLSLIASSIVIRWGILFTTLLFQVINKNIKETEHIQLLNNPLADKILYIIFTVILSIFLYQKRTGNDFNFNVFKKFKKFNKVNKVNKDDEYTAYNENDSDEQYVLVKINDKDSDL